MAEGSRREVRVGAFPSRQLTVPLVVVAFLVGIGVGLLLGWQVWPVKWYDMDPSDLRLQHQRTYVEMTADSLAVTGDTEAAKRRLYELTDEDTSWQWVANLIEQVAMERDKAGNGAGSLRLRRMALSAGLPIPTPTAPEPPKTSAFPTGGLGDILSAMPRWLILLLALGAFVIALSLVTWLLLLLIRGRSPKREPVAEWSPVPPEPQSSAQATQVPSASYRPASEQVPWEAAEQSAEIPQVQRQPDVPPAYEPVPPRPAESGLSSTPELPTTASLAPTAISSLEEPVESEGALSADSGEIQAEIPLEGELYPDGEGVSSITKEPFPGGMVEQTMAADRGTRSAKAPQPKSVPPGALGAFEAEYHYGDDDFDCSFSIETQDKEFLGECGVSISDVLGADDVQQVDAFDIWLFDKGDIRTVSKVLVSDYAYQDEATRARLEAKGELLVAQVGLTVTLETLSLRALVTIKDFGYIPDDQAARETGGSATSFAGVFSHFSVDMIVERVGNTL